MPALALNALGLAMLGVFSAVATTGFCVGATGLGIGFSACLVTLNWVGIAILHPYGVGGDGSNGASPVAGVGVSIGASLAGVRALGGVGVKAG